MAFDPTDYDATVREMARKRHADPKPHAKDCVLDTNHSGACEVSSVTLGERAGYEAPEPTNDVYTPPSPPQRPIVHVGEVLGQFYSEMTQLIREHQALKAFEGRVVEAAKSPAAWLQLRQELAK